MIDAAQTAFGHMDFAAPPQGAVLSCPRKTTSLPDGAVLALPSGDWMATTQDLPLAQDAKALKEAARALWATGILDHEELALRCHQESEEAWPDAPHRISDESKLLLSHLDRDWHKRIRLSNRISLAGALDPALALWPADGTIPFSLPIFVENQQELLSRLQDERIFATALWPDVERDPEKHPLADWVASHLVSLPIDQRHEEADMLRVAKAVNRWASPAYQAERPPSMMMF